MGLDVLYLVHMGRYADEFWTAVLPPAYLCYAILPFLQTLPPRIAADKAESEGSSIKVRAFNLWILRHASIQVNTFASAHVVASAAVSLELLRRLPEAGLLYVWLSVGIAIGAVAGRYHYAADAILGAVLAFAWQLFARSLSL